MPIAHWVTPDGEPRRYDTRFFVARCPTASVPDPTIRETEALEWMTPAEATTGERGRRSCCRRRPGPCCGSSCVDHSDEVLAWAGMHTIVRIQPNLHRTGPQTMLTLPGDPLHPALAWLGPARGHEIPAAPGQGMAADTTLIARIDRLIELFNNRSLDLPDGLFDRRTQFLLNGAPFESLLGQSPADPLILMLARGPAGYRFSVKALQHAIPDARVQRGEPGAAMPTAARASSGSRVNCGEPAGRSKRSLIRHSDPGGRRPVATAGGHARRRRPQSDSRGAAATLTAPVSIPGAPGRLVPRRTTWHAW